MSYNPKLTYCPLCKALKSPLAGLCRACYAKATQAGAKNTGQIQIWIEQQSGLAGVPR